MDEQNFLSETPEPMPVFEPQPQPSPNKKLDPNKLILSGAILLAALIVAGSLLYANLRQNGAVDTKPKDTVATLKQWAKDLKLDKTKFNTCLDEKRYQSKIDKDTADGGRLGIGGTPSFFINNQSVVGALPYADFKKVIDTELAKKKPDATNIARDNSADGAFIGNPGATVVMLEFSDYQCPFCRAFWRDAFAQIKRDYIDTGKLKFVHRDFPLAFHPAAIPAAEAVECAREQGKFWEMQDKIFSEQDKQGQDTIQF